MTSVASCPQRHLHTKAPDGYLEWHAFAERMAATHVQEPCTGLCGKLIWVPATDLCDICRHPVAHHHDDLPGLGCMLERCDCTWQPEPETPPSDSQST